MKKDIPADLPRIQTYLYSECVVCVMQKTVMELVEANKADFVNVNAGVFDWEREYGKDFKTYFDNDRETLIAGLENIMLGSSDDDSKRCALIVYRLICKMDKTTTESARHIIRKIIDNNPQFMFKFDVGSFLSELCQSSNDELLLYAYECEMDLIEKDLIGMMITRNKLCEKFPEIKKDIHGDILRKFFLINNKEETKTRGGFLIKAVKNNGICLTVNIIKTILESEYISEKQLILIRLAVQEVPEVWNMYEKEIENNAPMSSCI